MCRSEALLDNLHSPASASDMIRLLNSPPAPSLGCPFRRHLRLSNVKEECFHKQKLHYDLTTVIVNVKVIFLSKEKAYYVLTTVISCRGAPHYFTLVQSWPICILRECLRYNIFGQSHWRKQSHRTNYHMVPHHTFVPQFSPPVSEITLTCRTFLFSRTSARPVLTASCIV
jgi:hypothetical protein